jgi:nucleotide-binding universal stress UspA family protein
MKSIFVPTDFSACAANATHAAIELAAAYQATLHLHTIIDLPQGSPGMEKSQNAETNQAIHNAELLLKEWEGIAKEKNAPIKTGWATGNLITFTEAFTQSNNIDFVVMGSHGASGKNEYFLGSNTQKVVRRIHCPVLIIKEELKDYKIKNVVFASNFNSSDKRSFQYLLDFVKIFKPNIHLTQVNTSSWFREPYVLVKAAMEDFKNMAKVMDIP